MNNGQVNIIIADDHQVVRDGIRLMLGSDSNISIAGQAGSGEELKAMLASTQADILILDIELPDSSGLDLCNYVSANYPGLKVLILSMYTGEDFIFKAINEGAKGYLPKNTTRQELLEAVAAIAAGKEYFSPVISDIILKSYVRKARTHEQSGAEINDLSKREIEILKMLAEGMSNSQVAEKLFLSVRTIESHKSHIMQKLELHTTAELVKFAIKNKLIDI